MGRSPGIRSLSMPLQGSGPHPTPYVIMVFDFRKYIKAFGDIMAEPSMQELSPEERAQLSRVVMNILDSWGTSSQDKIGILALPEGTRTRSLQKFYNDTPFPDGQEVEERVDHVLGIAKALRTSYPANPKMANFWINTRNKKFGNRTPLVCMLEDGLQGVVNVRIYLDCAYDWHTEDQRN